MYQYRRFARLKKASRLQRYWHRKREVKKINRKRRIAKTRRRHKTIARSRGYKYRVAHSGRTYLVGYRRLPSAEVGVKRKGSYNHYSPSNSHMQKWHRTH